MSTLLIYAHPQTKGHCSLILEETQRQLKRRKKKYELLDLYKMKYDPVLSAKEHYTAGGYEISKQNKQIQEKIKKSKHLIFIYPIWWNGSPAILKGFLDKVLTSRFAFKYVQLPVVKHIMGAVPLPLLKGRRAATFTTSGAKTWVFWLFEGRFRGLKTVLKDTLGFCGIKSKNFHLGYSQRVNDQTPARVKKQVTKGLNWLY